MNLPNKLTILRICLVPFFVATLLLEAIPYRYFVALLIFTVASLTDLLDGKIARSRGLVTNFGKLMDPLADKILVMSALICFVKLDLASAALVIIIMFREFAVTSIRLLAVEQGRVIAANIWGKIKTVSQIIAIVLILLMQGVLDLLKRFGGGLVPFQNVFTYTGDALIVVTAIFTVLSGVIYVKDGADLFRDR